MLCSFHRRIDHAVSSPWRALLQVRARAIRLQTDVVDGPGRLEATEEVSRARNGSKGADRSRAREEMLVGRKRAEADGVLRSCFAYERVVACLRGSESNGNGA